MGRAVLAPRIAEVDVDAADRILGGNAVSYTHLDVYKRQILGSLDRFMAYLIEETKGKFPTWLAPTPVSYTHLDVYKRQAHRLPLRLRPELYQLCVQ